MGIRIVLLIVTARRFSLSSYSPLTDCLSFHNSAADGVSHSNSSYSHLTDCLSLHNSRWLSRPPSWSNNLIPLPDTVGRSNPLRTSSREFAFKLPTRILLRISAMTVNITCSAANVLEVSDLCLAGVINDSEICFPDMNKAR